MFPYVCLATMPLFCNVDWPRKIMAWFTGSSIYVTNYDTYGMCKKIAEGDAISEKPMKNADVAEKQNTSSDCREKAVRDLDENVIEESSNEPWQKDLSMENDSKDQKPLSDQKEEDDWSDENEQKVSAWRHKIGEKKKFQKTTGRKKFVVSLLLLHVALQFFLPYSHFITKVLLEYRERA